MTEAFLKTLALIAVFAAVVFAVERIVSAGVARRLQGREINKRLDLIGRGATRAQALQILRRKTSSVPADLPGFLIKPAQSLERTLMAAGVEIDTGKLMLAIIAAPIAVFVLIIVLMAATGTAFGFGRMIMVATFALLIGAVLPMYVFRFRANRMRRKMESQFPVALDVFVRGLRAGHPIAAALDLLTVEMPDPIGSQFGVVVDEVTYGADLRDALTAMADRWDLDDMRMFVVSLSVQSETGGNLAEILENLSKVIRERQSMMLKVRALSSEGRMTGMMLTALPMFAFTILFIASPGFYLDVADRAAFFWGYLVLGLMYVGGVFWIRRLVDLKV